MIVIRPRTTVVNNLCTAVFCHGLGIVSGEGGRLGILPEVYNLPVRVTPLYHSDTAPDPQYACEELPLSYSQLIHSLPMRHTVRCLAQDPRAEQSLWVCTLSVAMDESGDVSLTLDPTFQVVNRLGLNTTFIFFNRRAPPPPPRWIGPDLLAGGRQLLTGCARKRAPAVHTLCALQHTCLPAHQRMIKAWRWVTVVPAAYGL